MDWTYGALRALAVLGAIALAIGCLRRTFELKQTVPTRWHVLLPTILLLIHFGYMLQSIRHPHLSDIATTTLAAAQALASGANPYTASLDPAAMNSAGASFAGYKYLPVMPLAYSPLGLLFGKTGLRLTNVLLDLVTAVLIYASARRQGGRTVGLLAASLYLSLPLLLLQLYAQVVTDLVPVDFLLGAILASDSRPALSGLLVGLSISSKLLPGLAALPACVPHGRRVPFVVGLCAGLVPSLAALIAAPMPFINNIIFFNAVRPMDSTGWLLNLNPLLTDGIRAGLCLLWVATAIYSLRCATTAGTRCSLGVILTSTVILAGSGLHSNYMLWWMPFLSVALVISTVRESSETFGQDHPGWQRSA